MLATRQVLSESVEGTNHQPTTSCSSPPPPIAHRSSPSTDHHQPPSIPLRINPQSPRPRCLSAFPKRAIPIPARRRQEGPSSHKWSSRTNPLVVASLCWPRSTVHRPWRYGMRLRQGKSPPSCFSFSVSRTIRIPQYLLT
ncbi:hypothetical protein BO71DRAFT_1171 [Aspergillus ellipticus CBS 707.79]|uniref:Uncharacterized protein n=1 Tax=Aspergillus ellipticus CBS 707.79 TaxID=1448320 RepID=A0A319DV13_9EURO|nr:hypothetical protein BO71DRAFT_1171 [Aspergillus ellipticus CBS 707.79]